MFRLCTTRILPNTNNTGNFQLSNVDAVGVSPADNRFPSQRVAFCGTDILSLDSEYKSLCKTMVGRYGSWRVVSIVFR